VVDVTQLSARRVLTNVPAKNRYAKKQPKLKAGVGVVKRVSYGREGAGIWVLSDGTIQVDKPKAADCVKNGSPNDFPLAGLPKSRFYVDVELPPPAGSGLPGCQGRTVLTTERIGVGSRSIDYGLPAGVTFAGYIGNGPSFNALLSNDRAYLERVCQPDAQSGDVCNTETLITPYRVKQGTTTPGGEVVLVGEDGKVRTYLTSTANTMWDYEDGPPVVAPGVTRFQIPKLPAGVKYTAVTYDGVEVLSLARSDGKVVLRSDYSTNDWEWMPALQEAIPRAPGGLYYVDMVIQQGVAMLLRNDGQVVSARVKLSRNWENPPPAAKVPSLERGWVFTGIWPAPDGFYFGVAKIPAKKKAPSAVTKTKGPTKVTRGATAVFTVKVLTRAVVVGQQLVARIDGKVVGRGRADKSGKVRLTINTAGLGKGKHSVKLKTTALGKSTASKSVTVKLKVE
jgi:hypothetical protein